MADEVVGHAFSHGFHPEHTKRLAAYFAWTMTNVFRFPRSADDVPRGLRIPQWSWSGTIP